MSTGFLYDTRYLEHDTGHGHPECPERLSVTMNYLEQQPWFHHLKAISPIPAELKWLELVHSADYIEHVAASCREGLPYLDTPDVMIGRSSYDIALLAAGGAMKLADSVMNGEINNGFGLIRPPGHHAEQAQALGFCLFNNIAITAHYLQHEYDIDRIVILDWDVHHGNGTQHCFESDPSVFYISLHQYPFYPGTGGERETGRAGGSGTTLNCPMPAGSTDRDYEQVFHDRVIPAINDFQPEADTDFGRFRRPPQ
ncbi:MAG: histone deacetylase [Gammaproteobacteria bacterium]|nr:histone deacetylase [Gammaproteobacteria bacterium]